MPESPHSPLIIWKLTDGKPGHDNQSQGLINAIKKRIDCEQHTMTITNRWAGLIALLTGHWSEAKALPKPDFIIGAGHQTHFHLLAAKHRFGGRSIVLMKPSLPVSLFDLALIPEHDGYPATTNVLQTKGALNTIEPSGAHDPSQALILIGGPSKHHGWNEAALIQQVSQLLQSYPQQQFTLTTSRRTPETFIPALKQVQYANLQITPFEQTQAGWVAEKLAQSGSAWISEDSVSMIYEALTAHVTVGLLTMPVKKHSRVSAGVEQLVQQNLVHRLNEQAIAQQQVKTGLQEADRCADWIMDHWLRQPS